MAVLLEGQTEEVAQQLRGLPKKQVRVLVLEDSESTETDHMERVFVSRPEKATRPSAMGKYAHVSGSSEDFARRKQEDRDAEDRKRA